MARAVSREGRLPLVTCRKGDALLDRKLSGRGPRQVGGQRDGQNEFAKCGTHKGCGEGNPYLLPLYRECERWVNGEPAARDHGMGRGVSSTRGSGTCPTGRVPWDRAAVGNCTGRRVRNRKGRSRRKRKLSSARLCCVGLLAGLEARRATRELCCRRNKARLVQVENP